MQQSSELIHMTLVLENFVLTVPNFRVGAIFANVKQRPVSAHPQRKLRRWGNLTNKNKMSFRFIIAHSKQPDSRRMQVPPPS